MASSNMIVRVTIDDGSLEALKRLSRLAQFAEELAEDFSYREDVKEAIEDIEFLRTHVTTVK
jgi:hypothetical protein